MANTENTFVTPVFNGSASLRNAAGQLIENVTKTVRRGKNLDYPALYKEVSSLYHLDQIVPDLDNSGGVMVQQTPDNEPLPKEAVLLIVGLSACWFGIIFAVSWDAWKKKVKKKQEKY